MLTVGITFMVASVVVGIAVLALVAVTSSVARSAGRRTRVAMAISDPEEEALSYDPARETASYYQTDAPYRPAEQGVPYRADEPEVSYAADLEQAPRWAMVLMMISGAGLVLGLLLVMIASIP